MGLGLDLFLAPGLDYKRLDPQNPAFSDYVTRSFTREHISKRLVEQIIEDKIGELGGNKLIDHMLHEGKKLYLLELCLPHKPEYVVHEYTEEQLNWCAENETEMWTLFLDKEYLYESDRILINRYTQAAPTSRNMPPESPGRTANYLGLKIVKAYMKAFPETDIQGLLALKDGTQVLQASRYKPPRI